MKSELIIANTAEAFKPILCGVKPKNERIRRIQHEHELSDRALLWGRAKRKIVVVPRRPPDELTQHLRCAAGLGDDLHVVWPRRCGLSLCDAISDDENLRSRLSRFLEENPDACISAYALTGQYAALLDNLSANYVTPETIWATRYLDSKAGFRAEMTKLTKISPDVGVPEGFVCADHTEALGAVGWFLARGQPCILKANQGEAGWGLHFVKCYPGRSLQPMLDSVRNALSSDSIWMNGPFVVEEWVGAKSGEQAQSPSAEILVSDGGARLTYVCDQLIDDLGRFGGVIIGPGFPADKTRQQMERAAAVIGEHFHKLGVRGHFDVDFVVEPGGRAIAVETNVRRTGGTHVFDLKSRLGRHFSEHFFLAEDGYKFETPLSPEQVFYRLQSILFSKAKQDGVIVTLLPRGVPCLGYIIVARTYRRLRSLQRQLRVALE
jgi:hypothetical protein